MKGSVYSCLAALALVSSVESAKVQPPPTKDVVDTASRIASAIFEIYNVDTPFNVPGIIPESEWELSSAIMWSSLIEYWHYTGKDNYNSQTLKALAAQAGKKDDFARNLKQYDMNMITADQGLWGSAALLAAERGYPQPENVDKSWIEMAENAFEGFASYWNEDKRCGGGLPQLPKVVADNMHPSIPDVRDMLTQGAFFSMAARLARYTSDKKYADWADKTWAWVEKVGLLNTKTYTIKEPLLSEDCAMDEDDDNAEEVNSNAFMVLGAAFMYNVTEGDSKWKERAQGLTDHALKQWFKEADGILVNECEEDDCGSDWKVFKGASMSMYAQAVEVAPFLKDSLYTPIIKSGSAAMHACRDYEIHGEDSFSCGFLWAKGGQSRGAYPPYDEIAALGAVAPLLMDSSKPPQRAKDAGAIDANEKGDEKGDKGSQGDKGDDKKSAGVKMSINALVLSLAVMGGLL